MYNLTACSPELFSKLVDLQVQWVRAYFGECTIVAISENLADLHTQNVSRKAGQENIKNVHDKFKKFGFSLNFFHFFNEKSKCVRFLKPNVFQFLAFQLFFPFFLSLYLSSSPFLFVQLAPFFLFPFCHWNRFKNRKGRRGRRGEKTDSKTEVTSIDMTVVYSREVCLYVNVPVDGAQEYAA